MPSLSGYVKESVALLLVLIVLAVCVVYTARRVGLGRAIGPVELLARLPLEPRRSIYVVRVLNQVLIIGSSEAGLVKLGELSEGAATELRAQPTRGLAGALAAAWGRQSSRSSAEGPGPGAPGGAV